MSIDKNEYTRNSEQGKTHEGPERSSPYPVSRLGAPISLVNSAREIEAADRQIGSQLEGKLELIARQIKNLQEEARLVMEKARLDMMLHKASCSFTRIPGKIYFVYSQQNEQLHMSLLSPDDWQGEPPYPYEGAYRMENDMTWTRVD